MPHRGRRRPVEAPPECCDHRTTLHAHSPTTKYAVLAMVALDHMREFSALGERADAEVCRRTASELIDMHLRAVQRV